MTLSWSVDGWQWSSSVSSSSSSNTISATTSLSSSLSVSLSSSSSSVSSTTTTTMDVSVAPWWTYSSDTSLLVSILSILASKSCAVLVVTLVFFLGRIELRNSLTSDDTGTTCFFDAFAIDFLLLFCLFFDLDLWCGRDCSSSSSSSICLCCWSAAGRISSASGSKNETIASSSCCESSLSDEWWRSRASESFWGS